MKHLQLIAVLVFSTVMIYGYGSSTDADSKNVESDNKLYKTITTKLFCKNYYSRVKASFNSAIPKGAILKRRDLMNKGGHPHNIDQACSDYEKSISTFLNKLYVWGFGPKYSKYAESRRSGFVLVQETSNKEREKINHFRTMRVENYFEYYKGAPKLVGMPLKVTTGSLSEGGNVTSCLNEYLHPSAFLYTEFRILENSLEPQA